MANPDHIKWLLEGVDSWNQRREQQDFTPNFEDANIYEEFQNSGKLDKDDYIPLAGINLGRANFRGSCLSTPLTTCGADLRDAKLWHADFKDAQLTNSKFDSAILNGACLNGANLLGASLCDAKMLSARLHKTNLFQANLTNAELGLSYLKEADFSCAILKATDLTTANLTGASLGWSRPWQAKLYEDNHSTTKSHAQAGPHRRITCVADLIKECTKLGAHQTDRLLYYRGEEASNWKLQPSVMRRVQKSQVSLLSKESVMLLDLMSRRPEDFHNTPSAFAQWVLAQHHGLKTRLLDVTRNPLVALFCACDTAKKIGRIHVFSVPGEQVKSFNSDTISIIANFSKLSRAEQNLLLGWSGEDIEKREPDSKISYIYENAMRRLYHFIRQEKPFFEERIDPRDFFRVFIVEPQQAFERIRVQSGAFLISAFHERLERTKVLKWNPGIPIYDHSTLLVQTKNKQDILDELRLLNISRETLFPGLDEAADAVTKLYSK